jgi:hypothetical protein
LGACAILEAMMNRAHLEVNTFQAAEGPFGVG